MLDMGFEPQMRQIIQEADMPSGIQGRRCVPALPASLAVSLMLNDDYQNFRSTN